MLVVSPFCSYPESKSVASSCLQSVFRQWRMGRHWYRQREEIAPPKSQKKSLINICILYHLSCAHYSYVSQIWLATWVTIRFIITLLLEIMYLSWKSLFEILILGLHHQRRLIGDQHLPGQRCMWCYTRNLNDTSRPIFYIQGMLINECLCWIYMICFDILW